MKKGSEFEELVAEIYKQLSPQAEIKLNDKIQGFNSGIRREIDVSIRQKVANHEILIIVQAKDYSSAKIDVKVVDAFRSVIEDLRASKGVLVSAKGFTKSALEYGKNQKIDLLTAHDAKVKHWRKEIFFPTVIKVIERSASVDLGIDDQKEKFNDLEVSMEDKLFQLEDGIELYSLFDLLREHNKKLPLSNLEGIYNLDLNKFGLKLVYKKKSYSIESLTVVMKVVVEYYFKFAEIEDHKGFYNSIEGKYEKIEGAKFSTKFNFREKDSGWIKVMPKESEDELLYPPIVLDNWALFTIVDVES